MKDKSTLWYLHFVVYFLQVQRYNKEKSQELLAHQCSQKNYPFDFFFEKSLQERSDFNVLVISDSESEEDADLVEEENVVEEVSEEGVKDNNDQGNEAS